MTSLMCVARSVRRAGLVLAGTAAIAATGTGLAAAASAATGAAAPRCTVSFTTSVQDPAVGQDITLRWRTSGADLLVASWTSAPLPFIGSQVTTKSTPGAASYQVTGLKGGQYCGGGVVNVVYRTGSPASSSAPPAASPTSPTTPISSAATSSAPVSSPPPTATSASTATSAFPAQSPTGGSGVPWWEQPANLVVIGVLSLLGAAGLMQRERVRAVLIRRH